MQNKHSDDSQQHVQWSSAACRYKPIRGAEGGQRGWAGRTGVAEGGDLPVDDGVDPRFSGVHDHVVEADVTCMSCRQRSVKVNSKQCLCG